MKNMYNICQEKGKVGVFFMQYIFDEIKPNDNEMFKYFNKRDLEYILSLVNNYKLLLRDVINVSIDETFGLEIECEHAEWVKIKKRLIPDWELTDDLSLERGAEIKSPPLRDTKENWINLRNICNMLSKYAMVGIHSGGHVHVGIQALGNKEESLINFMKLWAVYEHIIYRFSYGEFLGPRPGIKDAAKPSKCDFINSCFLYEDAYATEKEILKYLMHEKCRAVNFKHYNTLRTLEFRCPNATLNPVVWQNNVNLFVKMMEYSTRKDFNNALVEEKREKIFIQEKTPNEIYIDDAIEFADLIFDNNLDKVYFLRQYLKSFEKSDKYELAKTFC